METGKFTPKSRRSCLLRACLLPSVHFSAAITRQALPPDASSMFLTPSSRLLMFIEDSGYGILFPTHTHTHTRKWIETMLCSHFPEIPGASGVGSARRPASRARA